MPSYKFGSLCKRQINIMSNRCKQLLGQGQTEISICFQTSSKKFIFYLFAYFLHNVFDHVNFYFTCKKYDS